MMEVQRGQVREEGIEARRVGDAASEVGHAQERIWTEREESQTGDRHWSERSETRRRQGPLASFVVEEIVVEEAMMHPTR
jgi:hypothetical protein